ncbi:hypothetical protein [Pseudonocardia acaciae]|uniref:hypothetical protein n=1 Tax=Pseudonocardia acaciae TaxID=551276 RepID=UPI00048F3260|nr:hypothetical protein [Pseudonocardia acaciae]
MRTSTRLAAYGAALVVLASGGYAVGSAVGPLSSEAGGTSEAMSSAGADQPGGLAASSGGYTLTPADPAFTPGAAKEFAFRVTGPDGAAVTGFDVEHDKRMHLIVVRRDTASFQHVHPEMDPDGTWRVPLTLPAAGSYRAFADFARTGGPAITLGVDLVAAGSFEPVTYQPSRTAHVDGYTVTLAGDLVPGRASPVSLTVSRDGREVTDLQPYLSAYGHLVALRGGDLAYLHVHPDGSPGDGRTAPGPTVTFVAEVPSAGTYRLFLDFQHGGVVRTAAFTVPTGPATAAAPPAAEHAHGH